MTNNNRIPGKNAMMEDDPLEMAVELEGGFPCGEFLWMDEGEENGELLSNTPVG